MQKLVVGIIVAIVLLHILDNAAGENVSNWFAFVLVMGILVYQREGLSTFSAQLQARLR